MDEHEEWWNRWQRTSMLLATLTTASAVAGAAVWLLVTLWLVKTVLFDLGDYMVEFGLVVGTVAWVAASAWTVPHLGWASRCADDLARPDVVTTRGLACVAVAGLALIVLVLPAAGMFLGYVVVAAVVGEAVLALHRAALLRRRPRWLLQSSR